jgi:tetratricopeptide (TPR) repeat protein
LLVCGAAGPAGPRLAPPTVADVVSAGILEAQQSALLQPRVRISLVSALGEVLIGQGESERAARLLAGNFAAAEESLAPRDPVRMEAGLMLARAEQAVGRRADARSRTDALLGLRSRTQPFRSELLAFSAQLAAEMYERARALRESAQATADCEQCPALTRARVLLARGDVLAQFQEDAAALGYFEQALDLQRSMHGAQHIAVAETLQRLSRLERRLDHMERAEALARESLAIVEASVPAPHQSRSQALDTLWQVLIDSNRDLEAIELGEQVVAMDEATLGSSHPARATAKNTLAFVHQRLGHVDRAIAGYREAIAISSQWPENLRRTATYKANLGNELGKAGRVAEGADLLQEALRDFRSMPDPDHGEICAALEKLGALHLMHGNPVAAVAAYTEADHLYRSRIANAPPTWHVYTLIGLGVALSETGDRVRATEHLEEAVRRIAELASMPFHARAKAHAGLALELAAAGDHDRARSLARAAAEDARQAPSLGRHTAAMLERLAPLLAD